MQLLQNKVALITGATRGIGRGIALNFAQNGANIAFTYVSSEEKAKAFEAELQALGVKAKGYKSDAGDFKAADELVTSVVAEFGTIDILVNNAGITRDKTLLKMSFSEWQQVIDVNLTGVFNCTKVIAPYMVEQKYGRIICTSSINGVHGAFGQTNYAAAKAGIIGMVRSWAKELGPKGITANAVAPGFIQTAMTDAMPDEVRNQAVATIPVRRIGKPEDIANAYLFLASDEASFVNGHVLSVNGGQAL